jgi:hypothetical protein
LCCVFQVRFRFDPESCHEFSLERKRGGHRKKTRVKKVQKRRVIEEKSKRRQELKREREEE